MATPAQQREFDLHFYFDPVCPFAWMTSKWVRMVAAQRDYRVDWRFISLRILNAHIDYASHFPPEYEAGHTAGLRLLRMMTRVRSEHGRAAVGSLYEAIGAHIFDKFCEEETRARIAYNFFGQCPIQVVGEEVELRHAPALHTDTAPPRDWRLSIVP